MSKKNLDLSQDNILTCAAYAIIGLLLIILRSGSLGILMTIVGALLIVLGIVDIIQNKDNTKGILEIIIGVAIIICGWLVADIVLLVFGVLLIVKGIMELTKTYKDGISAMIIPIVTIVIGVLLVIAKWALMDVFCVIAGIVFIVNAVLTLYGKSIMKQ